MTINRFWADAKKGRDTSDGLLERVAKDDVFQFPGGMRTASMQMWLWFGLTSVLGRVAYRHGGWPGFLLLLALGVFTIYVFIIRRGLHCGWKVDFDQRMIFRPAANGQTYPLDEDFSINLYSAPIPGGSSVWLVELTHRRRGTLIPLIEFHNDRHDTAKKFASELADRLGLRKVGSGFQ